MAFYQERNFDMFESNADYAHFFDDMSKNSFGNNQKKSIADKPKKSFKQVLNKFFNSLKHISKAKARKNTINFVQILKKNPSILFELYKKAKERIQTNLTQVKQKLLDVKKSLANLNKNINLLKRKIAVLSNKAKSLSKELVEVRNKIAKLKNQPDMQKELELLKRREKEILSQLQQLTNQIETLTVDLKSLELDRGTLEKEKFLLTEQEKDFTVRLDKLSEQENSSRQALGLEPERVQPLQMVLQQSIKENALRRQREQETTQVSYGNFAFRATLDSDFNMQNVQSSKVMPVFGRVGKETPQFMKQRAYDDSIAQKYSVRNRFFKELNGTHHENSFRDKIENARARAMNPNNYEPNGRTRPPRDNRAM